MSMPLEQATTVTCALCEKELRHCHGTAIIIDGATHVCSDNPDCTLEVAEHWFASLEEK